MIENKKDYVIVIIATIIPIVIITASLLSMRGFFSNLQHRIWDVSAVIVVSVLAYLNLKIFFINKKKNFYCFIIANFFLAVGILHLLRMFFNGFLC